MTTQTFFVAGSHTDIGKTFVASALLRWAIARGLRAEAFKPVVSGFDPGDWGDSDPGRLLAALGRPLSADGLAAMSPLRYRAPLAPPIAARREGDLLMLSQLVTSCRLVRDSWSTDLGLIEGAGGVMTDWSGNRLLAGSDGRVLAVGNAALHAQLLASI